MLDADLPQPLGSSVVRKLEPDCAFKLLILKGREDRETGRHVKRAEQGSAPGVFTIFLLNGYFRT